MLFPPTPPQLGRLFPSLANPPERPLFLSVWGFCRPPVLSRPPPHATPRLFFFSRPTSFNTPASTLSQSSPRCRLFLDQRLLFRCNVFFAQCRFLLASFLARESVPSTASTVSRPGRVNPLRRLSQPPGPRRIAAPCQMAYCLLIMAVDRKPSNTS